MRNCLFAAFISAIWIGTAWLQPVAAFDRESMEEEGGDSFAFFGNTQDKIYGISFVKGTWIKDTPIMGNYFLSIYKNGKEESSYSGAGMTIRLMPRWWFSPFAGGGGGYNYSISRKSTKETQDADAATTKGEPVEPKDRGDSHWAALAEGGFRIAPIKNFGLL
ncbi:MAG: hypothetical protein C0404_07940, partial [Verrucomicrobia bacterium]|nr:hypothetical protein [Verrucomicrobiota bacterium]